LKEKPSEDMEGDESTSNFSYDLFHHKMKVWMNHNKMDKDEGPKDNIRNGFMIGAWPPKSSNRPP
jgi:hypothetical protein